MAQAALELEFPHREAERQLETVVDWGRYAELFVYDDRAEVFSIESIPPTMAPLKPEGGASPGGTSLPA